MRIELDIKAWKDLMESRSDLSAKIQLMVNVRNVKWTEIEGYYNNDANAALAAVCIDIRQTIERHVEGF